MAQWSRSILPLACGWERRGDRQLGAGVAAQVRSVGRALSDTTREILTPREVIQATAPRRTAGAVTAVSSLWI
jgi:hypothetical protein